jgi:hypothetical protein
MARTVYGLGAHRLKIAAVLSRRSKHRRRRPAVNLRYYSSLGSTNVAFAVVPFWWPLHSGGGPRGVDVRQVSGGCAWSPIR